MEGRLAPNVELLADAVTVIYTVSDIVKSADVSFNILNPLSEDVTVRVAISETDVPAAADFIEGPLVLTANGSILTRSEIKLSAGERFIVIADKAGVTVRVWGTENT